jgi:uncharacterized protein (TIGR02186 family)
MRAARWGLRALGALGLAFFAARSGAQTPGDPAEGHGTLAVEPDVVRVGLFFNGTLLHVHGTIPAGQKAAVVCEGSEGRLDLKKKGRVWGLFWMNAGDVVFDNVPSVYLLCTSAPLKELAPAGVLARLGVGAAALEARATAGDAAAGSAALFGELVRLKTGEGLWSFVEGTVSLKPGGEGRLEVAADLFLPAKTPPGEYRIRLFSFRDGKGADLAGTTMIARQVGFAAFISRMAHERGLLYGIVSVVVAIAAGMLTGVVFGRGSRRPH